MTVFKVILVAVMGLLTGGLGMALYLGAWGSLVVGFLLAFALIAAGAWVLAAMKPGYIWAVYALVTMGVTVYLPAFNLSNDYTFTLDRNLTFLWWFLALVAVVAPWVWERLHPHTVPAAPTGLNGAQPYPSMYGQWSPQPGGPVYGQGPMPSTEPVDGPFYK